MKTLLAYDASLDSIQVLLSGLEPNVLTVAVGPNDDALATIDAALAESGARKLLVLCHGQAGELLLGAEPIQSKQLVERAGTLASWGLESIELYACHAGADAAFVQTLEQLSGATVAASSGVVGHASLGGSWTLQGSARNGIAPISRAAMDQWAVALAAPPSVSTPDLVQASDTGSSQTDNITTDTTPTLTGTAPINTSVTFFNGANSIGTTTSNGTGNYSFTPTYCLTVVNSSLVIPKLFSSYLG